MEARMSIRPILLLGNPALRSVAARVREFNTSELQRLVADLRDTLAEFRVRRGFGRGISAPQIGEGRRVIYVQADETLTLVNPVIRRRSRTMMTLWDDCFSFPELAVKLKRHVSVEVEYHDTGGKKHVLRARGGVAELLQHELDHLDGVLAIDRAIDTRHIVYRSEIGALSGSPPGTRKEM
jgi:peptide deformylase